jgi:DNA (cytosine-5)-methyltransferase 1
MTRPRLLDLFCCEGGAAMGYHRAGFDVVGVDIVPQPRYPFQFVQGDALEYVAAHGHEFEAIHTSPPCQAYSLTQRIRGNTHPELIAPTREALQATGRPYVIENVPGAPLLNPVTLVGSMFGLRTMRPRLFECSFDVPFVLAPPAAARHAKMGRKPKQGEYIHVAGNFSDVENARDVMGCDWMTRDGLAQAIPPAYTEYIGGYLMQVLGERVEVAL